MVFYRLIFRCFYPVEKQWKRTMIGVAMAKKIWKNHPLRNAIWTYGIEYHGSMAAMCLLAENLESLPTINIGSQPQRAEMQQIM